MERITYNMESDYYEFLQMLKSLRQTFKVVTSNYRVEIHVGEVIHKFLAEERDVRFFSACQKLKSRVNQDLLKIEEIKNDPIMKIGENYYGSKEFLVPFSAHTVGNIDINNAYPSVLFNRNLIDQDAFSWLQTLPKDVKLAAIGSLGSTTTTLFYYQGEETGVKVEEAPLKCVFQYCVKNIDLLMKDLSFELGDDFIFFWVDGIYFKSCATNAQLKRCDEMIHELGYQYKLEWLRDFSIRRSSYKLLVDYYKGNKLKQFEFPDKNILYLKNRALSYANKKIKPNY